MTEVGRIETVQDADELLELSKSKPVWIFKHSSTCGISDTALSEFRRFVEYDARREESEFRMLTVQQARAASDHIAKQSRVRHETPQAILLRDGETVWHGSHWEVTLEKLLTAQVGSSGEEFDVVSESIEVL